jgi:hypothetical protein
MKYSSFLASRIPIDIELGQEYILNWWRHRNIHCKFIQVTPKGFNFVDLKTNKCFIYPHFYQVKDKPMRFFVHKNLLLVKLPNNGTNIQSA